MGKIYSLIFILLPFFLSAQIEDLQKVRLSELQQSECDIDSEASAMYLARTSYTRLEVNVKGRLELLTTVKERIKIFTKEGFKFAAKRIALRKNRGDDDDIFVEGTLYYYFKNKVEKNRFKKNQVYITNENEYWNYASFKFDNVKEGCIIDWEYTIESPFQYLIPEFKYQSEIPTKYFHGVVRLIENTVFRYNTIGDCNIEITEFSDYRNIDYYGNPGNPVVSNKGTPGGEIKIRETVIQSKGSDIPAVHFEPYSGNINNHKCLTTFELVVLATFNGQRKNVSLEWGDVARNLNDKSSFGGELNEIKYFQDDLALLKKTSSQDSLSVNIYNFVRNKMNWNGFRSIHAVDHLKVGYKSGVGTAGEINLILIAMLREAGLKANPILLSTRTNGIPLLPTIDGFDHVIASVEIDQELILLDASVKNSPFGVLSLEVINWLGRLVQENGDSEFVSLRPREVNKKSHLVSATIDDEGILVGEMIQTLERNHAVDFLDKYSTYTEGDFMGVFEKEMNFRYVINNFEILNLNNFEGPLKFKSKYQSDKCVEIHDDEIIVNSVLFLEGENSLFEANERKYPIDFIVPWEKKFVINLKIPSGYEVEKLPEDLILMLPEDKGEMKYVCQNSGSDVNVLSQVNINTPIFSVEYYEIIKDFFEKISEKQNEKIILKKVQ